MFRCDQISQAALETFQNDLQKIRTTLDSGDIVQKFGEEATSLVNAALGSFPWGNIDTSILATC
jgi:hypothetical protein